MEVTSSSLRNSSVSEMMKLSLPDKGPEAATREPSRAPSPASHREFTSGDEQVALPTPRIVYGPGADNQFAPKILSRGEPLPTIPSIMQCSPPPGLMEPSSPQVADLCAEEKSKWYLDALPDADDTTCKSTASTATPTCSPPGLEPVVGAQFCAAFGANSDEADPPSIGSVGHPANCQPACRYMKRKGGCRDGKNCNSCHFCFWRRPENSEGKAASNLDNEAFQSVGSVGHPTNCGQTCKYARRKGGCRDKAACTKCHKCLWHRNSDTARKTTRDPASVEPAEIAEKLPGQLAEQVVVPAEPDLQSAAVAEVVPTSASAPLDQIFEKNLFETVGSKASSPSEAAELGVMAQEIFGESSQSLHRALVDLFRRL